MQLITKRSALLFAISAMAIYFIVSTLTSSITTKQMIQRLAENQIIEQKQGVGAAIAIIENGKVEQLFIGSTQFQGDVAINNQQLFEIGSITKTFTALALADMVNKGLMDLNAPAQNYLPKEIKLPSKDGKQITILDLATHNSGLPRMPSNFEGMDPQDPYRDYDAKRMVDFLNNHQLSRAPGDAREYSNLGFGLLGHILSLVDGKPYQQVIQDRVLKPLALNETYIKVPKELEKSYIDGHNHMSVTAEHWSFDALAGAGAIKSNLNDMIKYLQANMQAKPSKAIALSHKARVDFGNPMTDIGLSWIISKHKNGAYTWHNGGTAGFKAFIGFDKAAQKGIVVLANSFYDLENIARAFLTGELSEQYSLLDAKPVDLSSAQLERLVGQYQLAPQFILTITTDGKGLYAQATNQPKFHVFATSPTEFFFKVVPAKLVFQLEKDNNASQVILLQNGQEIPGKRMK